MVFLIAVLSPRRILMTLILISLISWQLSRVYLALQDSLYQVWHTHQRRRIEQVWLHVKPLSLQRQTGHLLCDSHKQLRYCFDKGYCEGLLIGATCSVEQQADHMILGVSYAGGIYQYSYRHHFNESTQFASGSSWTFVR